MSRNMIRRACKLTILGALMIATILTAGCDAGSFMGGMRAFGGMMMGWM